jgi:hypothetical protein
MSELASFEFERLRDVIVHLFEARATHDIPSSMPAPPLEWSVPYRALAEEVGLDPDLSVGHSSPPPSSTLSSPPNLARPTGTRKGSDGGVDGRS